MSKYNELKNLKLEKGDGIGIPEIDEKDHKRIDELNALLEEAITKAEKYDSLNVALLQNERNEFEHLYYHYGIKEIKEYYHYLPNFINEMETYLKGKDNIIYPYKKKECRCSKCAEYTPEIFWKYKYSLELLSEKIKAMLEVKDNE